MTDLTGKTALVTGGAIGIGAGIALALARAGAEVAVTYHSHGADDVLAAINEVGATGRAYQLDATDPAAVADVVGRVIADSSTSGLDILVNNTGGLVARHQIAEMSDEHWHTVIDLNLTSAFLCTRAALAGLRDEGRVINISSLAGQNGGGPGAVAYATSKAALDGFTRGLAKELAGRKITVNSIAPGLILGTPFHETFTPPEAQQATIASIPVGRPGWPADVAAAALFLASPASSFTTGTVVDVNGGVNFH